MARSLSQVSHVCPVPRSTVVTLSTPQTSGLSPFPASCTLPLWVRGKPPHKPTMILWTNPTNVGMGITMLYFQRYGDTDITPVYRKFSIPYLSISVSLNILLTLMIVIRLVLHGRDLRAAPKSPVGIRGLYRTASTMLIESCALFAMSSLFVLGALVSVEDSYLGHFIADIFFPILAETQVRAFPQPRSPGQPPNVTVDWTGDRSTAHHPAGCQWERGDEPHYHHWTPLFIQH